MATAKKKPSNKDQQHFIPPNSTSGKIVPQPTTGTGSIMKGGGKVSKKRK